ncbi:MAG: response regulator transcription factor [Spirochaetales bacterium]|nr:response regulator transcription factor [Spirochaetales bacterium]
MKILVVEDDAKIASFIAKGLKQEGFSVERAGDGEEGLALALARRFDVLVVDLMLPKLSGYEIIGSLRKKGATTPILILSAKSGVDDKLQGFEAGSDDYLTKPFSFAELVARVRALARRAAPSAGETALVSGPLTLDLMSRRASRDGKEIELRPREFALLEYLMRHAGNVVSKTMIMEHIWSYYFDPETNIVDVLVHRLRAKVDDGFEPKLIHTVRGAGYVLSGR